MLQTRSSSCGVGGIVRGMSEETFPEVRWGRDPGPLLRRPVTAVIGSRLGAWCIRKLTPLDLRLLSRSSGRLTIFGPLGVPLLLLTTTGRKTGQRRRIPLVYLRESDRLFLVGSNFGQTRHPAWSSNLLADPNVSVAMGGQEIPVVATQLTGSERERIFRKFADYASNYYAYEGRAGRDIRVFELTRC
jgi:deazaflavin-dependent oxidoreductase (nitroreductase family)